jgi:hypothetical protein
MRRLGLSSSTLERKPQPFYKAYDRVNPVASDLPYLHIGLEVECA